MNCSAGEKAKQPARIEAAASTRAFSAREEQTVIHPYDTHDQCPQLRCCYATSNDRLFGDSGHLAYRLPVLDTGFGYSLCR